MKSLVFVAALAAVGMPASLGFSGEPPNQAVTSPQQVAALDNADRKFLDEASLGGLMEVKMGQLATKQAANEEVKKFGQRMIDDHTKINGDLAKVAQQKGVTVPQALDKKHQEKVDKLAKLGGVDFDKEYMSEIVSEHESDVKDFEKAAKDAKDPGVKAFAQGALPMLRDHLNQAKDIESRVKQEKKP